MSEVFVYNELDPGQAERLAILSEECGEVIQIIGKILRHGFTSTNPFKPNLNNRELLEDEIGHVFYIVKQMSLKGDIMMNSIMKSMTSKAETIKPYLHHQ